MARRQLPPGITKTTTKTGLIRYRVRVRVGKKPSKAAPDKLVDAWDGHVHDTERAARDELAKIQAAVNAGTYTQKSGLTVKQAVDNYLAGKHRLRGTSAAKLKYDLATLVGEHGDRPLQEIAKGDLDKLVGALRAGGTLTEKGRARRPWSPRSTNSAVASMKQFFEDAHSQGLVARNVAARIDRVENVKTPVDAYTADEVKTLLAAFTGSRHAPAWELGLMGLRRGEICGLRWSDVDLKKKTLTICNNRTSDDAGNVIEGPPKTAASERVLPLPDRLVTVLKTARARQVAEKLAVGEVYRSGAYVLSNEIGEAYHPNSVSNMWSAAVKAAGVRHLKLHGARHTAATLMHLSGTPAVVIAAWIGHDDPSFTTRVYMHSNTDALKAAASVFERVVTSP